VRLKSTKENWNYLLKILHTYKGEFGRDIDYLLIIHRNQISTEFDITTMVSITIVEDYGSSSEL
jgi:hypothetical protein